MQSIGCALTLLITVPIFDLCVAGGNVLSRDFCNVQVSGKDLASTGRIEIDELYSPAFG